MQGILPDHGKPTGLPSQRLPQTPVGGYRHAHSLGASQDLKRYFLSISGSERNRINYVSYVGNFFNAAFNPKDPHRLLNVNPIDAARLELRRDGLLPSKSKKKDRWQVQTPKLLTLDQVPNALEIAIELKEHGTFDFVLLGLFVGLWSRSLKLVHLQSWFRSLESNKTMKGKRYSTEQKIRMLCAADQAGMRIIDVCREHGISEQSFHRWSVILG